MDHERTLGPHAGGGGRDLEETSPLDELTLPMAGPDPSPRRPRGSMIDRYVVIGELGEGGMGVVYVAYDPELDRRVAIKLLQPSFVGEGRARLLREAQAIARIAHPNVVAVHDVGEVDDSVFVAMELVEGSTLRRWLRDRARALPEILEVFRQAGRGLAAAHRAELVHRDFKPENALVGRDGRVRVVDFGLARGRGSAESLAGELAASASGSLIDLDAALTEMGMVMGTPAYMPPEQLAGGVATAASDQFAFCVALHEALYGVRPYEGTDVDSLRDNVEAGRLREPPSNARPVPTWLRRALVRGLQTDPAQRYPSMDALLQELARDPSAARRRWWRGGLATAGAIAVAVLAYRTGASSSSQAPCAAVVGELDVVWNRARRDAIANAFRQTDLPHATDTWRRVDEQLGTYASAWAQQSVAACEATHVHHTQSAALYEQRRRCLGERLQRLDAFLDVLAEPDAHGVDGAVARARALPDLGGCEDVEALLAGVAPPQRESTRREVAALQEALTRAEALNEAARYREALELLEPLLVRARATEYLPIIAKVEHVLSQVQRALDLPEGSAMLKAAFRDALVAGDDRRAAGIAIEIAHELGYQQRRHERGHEWLEIAQALVQRIGGDAHLEIASVNTEAMIAIRRAHYDEALALFERLLQMQQDFDPDDPNLAVALMNLGSAYAERREYARAREYLERSAAHTRRVLGPQHPSMTALYANLAIISMMQGRYEDAEVQLEPTLSLQKALLGDRHPDYARSLGSMAIVQRHLGHPAEAERLHREALEIRHAKLGPDHPEVAESLRNLAWCVADQGRLDEAITLTEQAQQTDARRLEPDHPQHGNDAGQLALLLAEAGRFREAEAAADRAMSLLQPGGPQHNASLEARRAKGWAQRRRGRVRAAVDTLQAALQAAEDHETAPGVLAQLRLELALALDDTGAPLERVRALMEQARAGLEGTSADNARERRRIDAWLTAHAPENAASGSEPTPDDDANAPTGDAIPTPSG